MKIAKLFNIYSARVRDIRIRSQESGGKVEVEVDGRVESLGPVATRSLIRKLQTAAAHAEAHPPNAHLADSTHREYEHLS